MAGQMLQFALNLSMLTSGNLAPGTEKAAKAMSQLQGRMQELQKAGKGIQAFQTQQSKVEALRQKMVAAREKVRVLRDEMRKTDSPTAAMQREFGQAQKEAGLLGERFQEQRKKLADLNSELLKSGVNTSKLVAEQNKLASQTDKVRAAQDKLTAAQDKYNSLRAKVFDWNNLKSTLLPATATVEAIKAPVKLAADFESAIARVHAVGFTDGENLEGLAKMREQALRLGAETKFTAVQAAQAQEQLIRGGMTPEQTMQAMTGTLNMAAAEGMSIDEAASIIAKGLGGMGLEASLAPRYADVLAYTSSKSNTDIRNISEAMKIAGPVAAAQGIQLEKLASYIGVFANKGYEASVVGNTISSSISRLARRPKEADAALNSLGVAVKTKSGRLVELPDIMRQISEAFKRKNIGELEQMGYMSKIFGAEYGKQMIAFMAAVTSGEQERLEAGEYNESFNWSGKQTQINLDTLNGQLDILASAWDGVRIAAGEAFSPIIRQGVEILSSALSKVNALMIEFPTLTKAALFTAAGISLSKTAAGVVGIGKALLQLPMAKAALWSAENAAAIASGTGQLSVMSRVFVAMSHPIATIKAAFVGLGSIIMAHPLIAFGTLVAGGIAYALTQSEAFKKWWDSWTMDDVFAALNGYIDGTISYVKSAWQGVIDWWDSFTFPDIFAVIRGYADGAFGYVKAAWQGLSDWWSSFTFPDVFAGLWDSCVNAIEAVKGIWQDFMNWISSFNPFSSWNVPDTVNVGGVSHSTGGHAQAANAMRALGGYQPPEIKNAKGGIYNRPIWTWAAEDGAEAIIPLTDKSRGVPLLMQAAEMLGMFSAGDSQSASYTVPAMTSSVQSANTSTTTTAYPQAGPVVPNITINVTGNDDMDIAGRIKQAVLEALQEISGYEERVAYA